MRVKVRVGVERAWAALSSASMKPSTCACTLLFALALSSSCVGFGVAVLGLGLLLPQPPHLYPVHPTPTAYTLTPTSLTCFSSTPMSLSAPQYVFMSRSRRERAPLAPSRALNRWSRRRPSLG